VTVARAPAAMKRSGGRRTIPHVAAATVNWTRAEIDEALDAVSASATVRGRKRALEELNRARAKVAVKDNPKAPVTIRFGERPAALIAEVLQGRPSPVARSALCRLEEAALHAVRGARKAKRNEVTLSNVKADTRDHRVRHVSGRPRPAR
jgi:hypothetical protein